MRTHEARIAASLAVALAFAAASAGAQQDSSMRRDTANGSVQMPPADTLVANLAGINEVPGPGDSAATAMAIITVAGGQVCYDLDVHGMTAPTAAHIHKAPVGEAGKVVVPLETPTDGRSKGCATPPADVAEDLLEHPEEFYVNVHDATHPKGAIRGQLARKKGE